MNHLSCQAHGQEGSLLKVESPTKNVRAWLPSTLNWFKDFLRITSVSESSTCSVITKLPLDFCLKTGVTVQAPENASSWWQNFELSIINSLGSAGYGHIEGRAWLTLPWSWPHSRKVATRKQEDWTVDSIHTNSSSAYQLGDVSVAAGPQSECGPCCGDSCEDKWKTVKWWNLDGSGRCLAKGRQHMRSTGRIPHESNLQGWRSGATVLHHVVVACSVSVYP